MIKDASGRESDAVRSRALEERERLAQAAGGIATFRWDLASSECEMTPQIAALFGFGRDEPSPSFADWQGTILADDFLKLRAAIEDAAHTGSFYAEFRVRGSDGGLRWITGKGEASPDESGGRRYLSGVYRDITERKQLEARLLALNETLEARVAEIRDEARTLEILNRTGAAVAGELDLERLVQTVTDAGVELTGAQFGAFFYNLVDDKGESYSLFTVSGVPREAFAKFPMPRNTAIFAPTFRGEGPVRSDDILADPRYGQNPPHHGMPIGHLPVRSYLAIPVVSRSGEVIGGLLFGHPEPGIFSERAERIVVGIAGQAATAVDNARLYEASQRELAARRLAERELQRVNETLEQRVAEEVSRRQEVEAALRQSQKMDAIGQLTGGIAHDFNNLLTVISGNIEILQRRLPVDDDSQRMVTAALRGTARAALLTERLLAFSRRQPLAPRSTALNKLVAGMSELLKRIIGEAITIETVLAGGLWQTFADVNQLENALINLAVNARDAMPDGGRLTIETANCYLDESYVAMHGDVRAGQYVGVFVTDTGIGMSEDVVAKAFEPFFTTKGVGHGTGLGLSQVYGFLKQSGGHVKIYSEIGQGTTIKLYFPRHRVKDDVIDQPPVAFPPPRARKGEWVLIVEDDPDVRSFTIEMVEDLGYQVLSAEDGPGALRLLALHPEMQLLFTDVILPGGMTGRELADEAVRRQPLLKVLFTTGYARNAIVHHGRLDAGVDVVFKPFTYTEVAAKIRRVLDH
jgi:signal transduction histidine kinase/CheY-like chemotaxis protein